MYATQRQAWVALGSKRCQGNTLAGLVLALGLLISVACTASAEDAAPTISASTPARHAQPAWNLAQSRDYVAWTVSFVQDAVVAWAQDYQLEAYRTHAQMAAAGRVCARAQAVWAVRLRAGHWPPELRQKVQATIAETLRLRDWWATYAALPTKAAMNVYDPTHPGFPALTRLISAMRTDPYRP